MKAHIHIRKRILVFTGVAMSIYGIAQATTNAYAPAPFSDYQVILDRMPFGAPPAPEIIGGNIPAPGAAELQAEQQKLAKQINLSCINITPDGGVAVGFSDLSTKPPMNHYLRVGMSAAGWTVLAADYDAESATITQTNGIVITLKLGAGLIPATTPLARVGPTVAATVKSPIMPTLNSSLHKPLLDGGNLKSYMDRLRDRKTKESTETAAAEAAARQQQEEIARKTTEEVMKKREREMNLRLIEKGENPISPITLTAEEDAALVAKGVLTPTPAISQ